ncbi:MAG: hypothetical protein SPM04_07020 [Lachnospira sp.]|nr:hypothetical protein [Lachnospira sp.]
MQTFTDVFAAASICEVKTVLNENKVKMMTRMAIYEKNEGKKMLRTAKFFKGDYVSLAVLKSTIATTFAFIIVALMVVLCNTESIIRQINSMDYAALGKKIIVYYVLALIVYAVISGIYSAYQYDKTRSGIKKYIMRLNKLERFYNLQRKKK